MKPARRPALRRIAALFAAVMALPPATARAQSADGSASSFMIVDCLLPGQVRKMGRSLTYIGQRRAIRTAASDCEIRGGEYVASDRADYRTALQVWMPLAQGGDARAQNYVGEIFEKGLGRPVDYAAAASWYERASAQSHPPAKINLAHLLAEGLGMAADRARADALLLEASGLPPTIPVLIETQQSAELASLRARISQHDADMGVVQSDRDAMARLLLSKQADVARLTGELAAERQALAAEKAGIAGQSEKPALVAQLQAHLTQAEQALAARTAEKESALAAAAAAQQGAAQRLESAELRVSRLQAAYDTATRAMQSLQSGGARKDRERIAAQAALDRMATQLKAADSSLAAERAEAERARLASADQVAGLQRALTTATAERDRLEQQAGASKALMAAQSAQLKAREDSLAQAEQRLLALRSEIFPQGDLPVIELIEPTLVATRGAQVVFVAPTLQRRAILGRVKARDTVSLLTINGQRQTADAAGLFQVDVPILAPSTPVEIVAIDLKGRRSAMAFELQRQQPVVALPTTSPPPRAAMRLTPGPQHALLIANAKYATLPGLKTPRADVDALAQVLRDHYGFTVTILYDATRYQMLSALNRLRMTLTDKDDLLIYYAGHGHKMTMDGRERGYWLPVDAEENNPANWISTLDVTDMLASMNVHKALLISDSCYSGLLTRGLVRLFDGASDQAREDYLKMVMAQKSRNVLTSGSDLPVMDGGGGRNSIFAKALVRTLQQNNDPMQGQDLARAVQQTVNYTAQSMDFEQRPQYGPLQLAGHESGDYIFVPRP